MSIEKQERNELHDVCRLDIGSPRSGKMNDLERLAMLKQKASEETRSFGCLDFLRVVVLLAVTCAFIVVFFRIAVLTNEVDGLYIRLAEIKGLETQGQSWNSNFNRKCNCSTESSHHFQRSRRDVSGSSEGEAEAHPAHNEISAQPAADSHLVIHLVSMETNDTHLDITRGEYFSWHIDTPSDRQRPTGSAPWFELIQDKYLMFPVAGYYYIYSQITFEDSQTRSIGQQVVTFGKCGAGNMEVLQTTSLTQMTRPANDVSADKRDSSYSGGVVYLSAGDLVAVRPYLDLTTGLRVSQTEVDTYFGAFLVSEDSSAISLEANCV